MAHFCFKKDLIFSLHLIVHLRRLDGGAKNVRYYQPVWPDGQIFFPIFGHLQQWNFAQKHTKSPKVGSQLCQISNKPLKCCQRFLNFCLIGKISPNLVTLGPGLFDIAALTEDKRGQSLNSNSIKCPAFGIEFLTSFLFPSVYATQCDQI